MSTLDVFRHHLREIATTTPTAAEAFDTGVDVLPAELGRSQALLLFDDL
jgi:hypothetical protein